jgi:uncharacterized membrane protein
MKFKNNSSRLEELDVLRGFAALNVVLFHYTAMEKAATVIKKRLIFYPPCNQIVN